MSVESNSFFKMNIDRIPVLTFFLLMSVMGTYANLKFSMDFLKHVGIGYPVLISKEGLIDNLINVPANIPTTHVSYQVNKDEDKIANLLIDLRHRGYLSWVLFLDDGHTKLITILVNEYQIFRSKISGLCQESDISPKSLKLSLDTQLFYYTQYENTFHKRAVRYFMLNCQTE